MQIQTSGKNLDIGAAFQEHVKERLSEGISKYFDGAVSAQVVVEKQRGAFNTECTVHLPTGLVLQASGEGGDAYSSFEEAMEHMETRLRRYKRRLISHTKKRQKPMEAHPAQSYVLAPAEESESADEEEEFVPAVVAESTEKVTEMSVGEAVMQLELAALPFVLFRNATHGGVNIVYTREDGHIGWVDPGPGKPE